MSKYTKMSAFVRKWKPIIVEVAIEKGEALGFKVEPVIEMPPAIIEHAKHEGFKPRKPELLLTSEEGNTLYLFLGNSLAELYYLDRDVPQMGIYSDLDDDVSVRERLGRVLDARFDTIAKGFDRDFSKAKHMKRASITDIETGEVTHFENKEMIAKDEQNRVRAAIMNNIFRNPN